MKKTVRLMLLAVALAACIGGAAYSLLKPVDVEVVEMQPREASMYFIEQGYAVAETAVEVYPMAGGEVLTVNVSEGDFVNKGAVICTIDFTDYEFQIGLVQSNIKAYQAQRSDISLQESKEKTALHTNRQDLAAQLEMLNAQKETKNISLDEQIKLQQNINARLQTSYEFAADNLANIKTLYESGALPKQAYDDAVKAADDVKAALEQGEMQLGIIMASGDSAIGSEEYFSAMEQSINAQIAGIDKQMNTSYTKAYSDYYTALIEGQNTSIAQLEKQIKDCTVVSPVQGYIRDLYIKDVNIASVQQPVASVSGTDIANIEVYVLTKDVADIQVGDIVKLTLKRRDEDVVMVSAVMKIDNKAEDKISALGVVEKKVKVTVEVPKGSEIKEGFDVDVTFTYYNEPDRIIVPKTALFTVDDKEMVWIVDDESRAKIIEVEKGVELRSEQVINSGLHIGDFVIKDANDNKLREGVKVNGTT